MLLTYYALFQFHDMMKSYYWSYIYIKCVLTGVSFFSISLLEDNGDDHYIQLLQHNIQDYKQLQTFFRNFSLLKFLLYSKKAKIWFISLYNTEVSIRMHDHWSQCPDNNEEGKVSIVCPVDNDCPVFGKLQLLYPGLIWGSS